MSTKENEMSLEEKKKLLATLKARRRELIEKLRETNKRRDELRAIREEKNKLAKELFNNAKEERSRRDEINEEVQVKKQMRDILREDADKIAKRLFELGNKMKTVNAPRNKRVGNKMRQLERKLETTPFLEKEQERQILQQLEDLSVEMAKLEQFKELKNEFKEMQQKLRHIRTEIKTYHTSVTTLAQESQVHQEKMVEHLKDARKIKKEADEAHAELMALNTTVSLIRKELDGLTQKIKNLSSDFTSQVQAMRKAKKQEARRMREKILDAKAEKILERYKEGSKLTLDEFKVLMERGLI